MTERTPVAIVGMAVLLPGAPDLARYWHNLVTGVDAVTDVPAGRGLPGGRGGFVAASAEPALSGTEPEQLIAVQVAAAAVDDAGGEGRLGDRSRTGVVLGRGGHLTPGIARLDQRVRTARQLVHTLAELVPGLSAGQLSEVHTAFTSALGEDRPEETLGLVATRVAHRLGLGGPAYTVDAACASSLVAVDQAVTELSIGRCDTMLAGGVHHCHDVTFWSVVERPRALSPSKRIRPFDRGADGIVLGEGAGVVVLKRLADAQRDGDRIYAVVRGSGVAGDGHGAGPAGQVRAVEMAWRAAGLDPAAPGSIGLLEAHGSGTPAGDEAELATLRQVFGEGEPAALGSVTSMIGHTMSAAGVAALVKAALAVHHGVLPPTLHCDDPHPALSGTRFAPVREAREWTGPRRAGVNAFGFGGINAHVVLEQAPGAAPVPAPVVTEPDRVLRFAADTTADLARLLDAADGDLRAAAPGTGRIRLALVAPTAKRLALARKAVAKGRPWRGRQDLWFSPAPLLADPRAKVAFVFPGLEAEFAPSLDDVAVHFGLPKPVVCTDGVGRHGLAVLQVDRLLDTALRGLGVVPDAVAGHSVGEWAAMVSAGVHSASEVDTLLARSDPESLQVPGVEFAVLGCPADRVRAALPPELVVSHENSPLQTIVCGPAEPIAQLLGEFRAQGVLCQVLPFRSGFHTPMLAPYLAPFRVFAETLAVHEPSVPLWSATLAAPFPRDEAAVREVYLRHLLEPVRFTELIRALYADGARVFVQAGHGQLGSLVDSILDRDEHLAIAASSAHRSGLDQLRRVAAAVWAEGGEPDFGVLTRRPGTVPIDLSAGLVSLCPEAAGLLPASAPRHPLAAEFDDLLRETAESASAVLAASRPPERMRFSLETMPYLLDHTFAPQREGWPDDTDRRPVVPATTIVRHLADAAEKAAPGARAIAVRDVRLHHWLVAAPAVEVALTVRPAGPGQLDLELGDYARARVELAADYPEPPALWPMPAGRAPRLSAQRFYGERWMFHGPRFQGLTETISVGARHVAATITVPPAPGALLDNIGQLFGLWAVETQEHYRVAFPVEIREFRFHSEEPVPGTRLHCLARVTEVTGTGMEFEAQLVRDGRVHAEVRGWRDRQFDCHPDIEPAYLVPERNLIAQRQPGGWYAAFERWPGLASRELYLGKYLSAAERAQYERVPVRDRRHWVLGRIAIKDAVRGLLWERGAGPIYPAEILVREDGTVTGCHGFALPELKVAFACHGELGAAIAGTDPWIRVSGDGPATLVNPPGLPPRQYRVSWKENSEQ
ncbi:acyl transferase domain-containing protein [Amycolatopsis sulphurea]|uniref:Acyl transferase domain-containing protein n=1 Tax=Amycolatopsis sulphurea TaxID=76022 RepID=A0A2A9FHU3_9PSEU|nr:type I polyketide synthase [Amycolatopsis sulphurea]PFG50944.1 acyl transferase domain-containing protein [Amycolatopsis sulphurea]